MLTGRTGAVEPPRRAFTLVELLVAAILIGVFGAALSAVLTRQQRFHRGATEIMDLHGQLRIAADLLVRELRAASSIGGDLYPGRMLDSAIELRAAVGVSAVCTLTVSPANQITLPPRDLLAAGNAVTVLRDAPTVGDSIVVFDEGPQLGKSDDSWVVRGVSAVATVVNGCAGTGFTSAGDAAKSAFVLTLTAALPPTVARGAPVRFFRRTHYSLYRSSDSRWYLGAYDCHASRSPACIAIQPVAGPYNAYRAAPGQSGLTFSYYDANGAATTNPLQVVRIDITLRGRTEFGVATGGGRTAAYADTLRVTAGIRNWR